MNVKERQMIVAKMILDLNEDASALCVQKLERYIKADGDITRRRIAEEIVKLREDYKSLIDELTKFNGELLADMNQLDNYWEMNIK